MKKFHHIFVPVFLSVFLSAAIAGTLVCSCGIGQTEKNAPLPPTDLKKREEVLREVKKKLEILKNADVKTTETMLSDDDYRVRKAAVKRMVGFKDLPNEAVETLGQKVEDENRDVRIAALVGLGSMDDDRAVDPLIEALADEDSKVRMWALKGIRRMEKRAVPVMIKHIATQSPISKLKFKDSSNKTKTLGDMLVETLSEMGQSAVPYLVEIVKDPKSDIATQAVDVLGTIGAGAAESLPYLLRLLESDADARLKKKAIEAVGKIGDMDPEVMPKLMELSNDSDSGIANAAEQALKKLEEAS